MSSDTQDRCAFKFRDDDGIERDCGGRKGAQRHKHNEELHPGGGNRGCHTFIPPGDTQDQELCKRLTVGAITLTHGFQHVLDPAVLEDAADRITTLLEQVAKLRDLDETHRRTNDELGEYNVELRAEIDSLRAKIVELSVVTVCCEHCGTVSEYRRLPEKSPRE